MNGVNGNAKIFRRLARGQTFNKNKIDGGLTKLGCVLTQSDHETRSFWRDQTRPFLVSTKSGEVRGVVGAAAGSLFVFKGSYRAVLIHYPDQAQKEDIVRSAMNERLILQK